MREPAAPSDRPSRMRSSAVLVGLATLLSACGATDAVSDFSADPPTPPTSTQPTTSLAAATTVTSLVRPPTPTPAELVDRTELLPWPTDDGLSPELAELLAAHERGDDWTGTLVGIALLDVLTDEWHLCWAIDESLPVGCGSGVRLSTAPPAYLASPERFESQTGDGSEQPAVVVSTSFVTLRGTFFADAALFVPSSDER